MRGLRAWPCAAVLPHHALQIDSALLLRRYSAPVTAACCHRAPDARTLHKQPVPALQGTAAAGPVFEELLASFSGKGRLHPSHLVLHDRSAPTYQLPASSMYADNTAAMVCCSLLPHVEDGCRLDLIAFTDVFRQVWLTPACCPLV